LTPCAYHIVGRNLFTEVFSRINTQRNKSNVGHIHPEFLRNAGTFSNCSYHAYQSAEAIDNPGEGWGGGLDRELEEAFFVFDRGEAGSSVAVEAVSCHAEAQVRGGCALGVQEDDAECSI
jgi:hypothetical protein